MANVTNNYGLLESFLQGDMQDGRTMLRSLIDGLDEVKQAAGIAQGVKSGNIATPPAAALSVSGANGAFTLSIANPSGYPGTVWNEISYSTVKGFTSGVTTMAPTTATSVVVNLPGQTLFFRVRTSLNQQNWSAYQLASQSAVGSGLVSSAATAAGAAFNQTNYGVVNSSAAGSTAAVEVNGAGGALTSLTSVKGAVDSVLPSATVVGVTPGSSQFVGWDGAHYLLRPTLAAVLDDGITPIGKVSVVSTAAPTLPVITPVVVSGYIVGFNVVSGGAGASQPYTLTFGSVGGGAGATFGAQTIVAGVLESIAAGNPGNGSYSGGTTVTASGGSGGGAAGGGTAAGGNGGRLTAV